MIKQSVYVFILSFLLTVVSGKTFITLMRKKKAGQPILKYVETHKDKSGTPTMGGLFFILSAIITFLIFKNSQTRLSIVALFIGLSYMIVGFLDDAIKIKSKDNLGLKAYQKIFFQLAIAIASGVFAYTNGLTSFYIPFTMRKVEIGIFSVPVVVFIFLAITNSVNLTDGLDGLASNTSVVYLLFLSVLIYLQSIMAKGNKTVNIEYENLIFLSISLVGALSGFLVFNTNKASIFMGDTGSLSLGGFIGSISIFSSNSFYIPILGIMFVVSCISVIVQVVYFKKTKKRVFLMAPLHHHFQMKGYSEQKISYIYSVITAILGLFCIIIYL